MLGSGGDPQNPTTDFRESEGGELNDAPSLRVRAKSGAALSKQEKAGVLAIRFPGKDCAARRFLLLCRSDGADHSGR